MIRDCETSVNGVLPNMLWLLVVALLCKGSTAWANGPYVEIGNSRIDVALILLLKIYPLCILISYVLFAIQGFRTDWRWGIANLFGPIPWIVFAVRRFGRAKVPLLFWVATLILLGATLAWVEMRSKNDIGESYAVLRIVVGSPPEKADEDMLMSKMEFLRSNYMLKRISKQFDLPEKWEVPEDKVIATLRKKIDFKVIEERGELIVSGRNIDSPLRNLIVNELCKMYVQQAKTTIFARNPVTGEEESILGGTEIKDLEISDGFEIEPMKITVVRLAQEKTGPSK